MRKQKKYHFIYKITNLKNGKYYIGMHSTDNLDDGYLGSGKKLKDAIRYHGKENFKREILEFCKTRKNLALREADIVNLDEMRNPNSYNSAVGGGGWNRSGQTASVETRQKMSKALKGRIVTDEHKEKIRQSNLGKKRSEEARKHMSDAQMGRILSEETRKKMGESRKGERNGNYGRNFTDEHREKLGSWQRGRKMDDTVKKKMSDSQLKRTDNNRGFYEGHEPWNKGMTPTEETRKKISDKLKGIPQIKVECPHCGKIGGRPQMYQYHFDKCKYQ